MGSMSQLERISRANSDYFLSGAKQTRVFIEAQYQIINDYNKERLRYPRGKIESSISEDWASLAYQIVGSESY